MLLCTTKDLVYKSQPTNNIFLNIYLLYLQDLNNPISRQTWKFYIKIIMYQSLF